MICTEKEARKKWCPMGRTADSTGSCGFNMWSNIGNRHTEPITWCVASECMMWVQITPEEGGCGLVSAPLLNSGD